MTEKKWMQYLIAALILMVGVAASLLILSRPWSRNENPGPAQMYTVTFYDNAGQIIETREAVAGTAVIPPALQAPGHIFKGWDNDLYAVTSDLSVNPICQSIGEEKNTVYADAVYADAAKMFSITPKLAGTVDCSAFTIEMGYDTALLSFEGAEPVLTGLTVEGGDGVLTLTWSADTALQQPTDLAVLHFRCTEDGSYSTTLPLLTKRIVTSVQGAAAYTDSTAYDGKLYLYQTNKE